MCLWVFLYSAAVYPAVSKGFLRNACFPVMAAFGGPRRGAGLGTDTGLALPCWPQEPNPGWGWGSKEAGEGRAEPNLARSTCGHCASDSRQGWAAVPQSPPACALCAQSPTSLLQVMILPFCASQLCPTTQAKHSLTVAFPCVAKHYPCFYIAGTVSSGKKLMG